MPADAALVAVGLRGVDVPISGLERPADRPLAVGAIADLPHPEPEHRNSCAVGKCSLLATNHVLSQHADLLTVDTKRISRLTLAAAPAFASPGAGC